MLFTPIRRVVAASLSLLIVASTGVPAVAALSKTSQVAPAVSCGATALSLTTSLGAGWPPNAGPATLSATLTPSAGCSGVTVSWSTNQHIRKHSFSTFGWYCSIAACPQSSGRATTSSVANASGTASAAFHTGSACVTLVVSVTNPALNTTLEPGALVTGGDCHGIVPSALSFTTQPGGAALGAPLNPQPQVSVEDRYGNVVLASSAAVTLSATFGGTLAGCGANPAVAYSGVARFTSCTVHPAGRFALRATSSALPSTTSAQFTITGTSHTVTFAPNGGTGTMANQVSAVPEPLTPNAFTYPGYAFTSWNTAANGSGTSYANGATYPFTSNATLYAQWRKLPIYTVVFNANGGAGTMTPQSDYAPTPLSQDAYTLTGYTFAGWNTRADGSGIGYANGATYPFTSNATLYAQWTPLPNHTVTFNANGGTGAMANEVSNVPKALTANTFTFAGNTFAGWNTASNGSGTSYANDATYSFASNVTLYAQWTPLPTHAVTFDANGGTGSMANEVSNVAEPLTANAFTRATYTFTGWNTAANGSGTSYPDGGTYAFTSDLTLYAQWSVFPNNTVTFDANGGTGAMAVESSNVPAALTANTFSNPGNTFKDWNTAADGSGTSYADGATYSFASSVTLFAQWTPLPTHTVTFNANGGTGAIANEVSNVPTPLTANAFTRTGYTFTGWNTAANGSGTGYPDGGTYPFTASATLYAQWTALPNHTVTFDANGGTGAMANEVSNVAAPLTTNTFTRAGYAFDGWNTAANGSGTSYPDGGDYPFTSDVTLYAQWSSLATFTVIFDANGGIGTMSPETSGLPAALTTNAFTRAGYVFQGWNTAANGSGTGYADGGTYPFAEDATLYAQWLSDAVLPGAPTITSVLGANGAVTVRWSTPATDGGAPISSYLVTSHPGGQSCSTAATSCTVTGLTNGTAYTFTVAARNAHGIGPASAPSSPVTPATLPGAVRRVTATDHLHVAIVSWLAPLSDGGAPITSYLVKANPGARTCRTKATRCMVSGLAYGVRFRFTVTALNRVGPSTPPALSGVVIPHLPGHRTLWGFAEGSAQITPLLRFEILRLARTIKGDGDTRLVVYGFTDDVGTPAANRGISLRRARAVGQLLRRDLGHLKVKGVSVRDVARGGARPLSSNQTSRGRARNRRVLVVFT